MLLPNNEHPTPAQVYEAGTIYATILRHVMNYPDFHYHEPPTAIIAKIDLDRTPNGLLFTYDFVQTTYTDYVLPFLPQGATRKCKELANPWAYADPNYQWEWTWDAEAGAMKDASGAVVDFPRLPLSQVNALASDLFMRGFLVKKVILENGTDMKARTMVGGQPVDFGEEARAAASKLD
ncbi:hypothetical protein F5B22DRAFT_631945 [Xylaria bambusicola]|uniref:uncharacterized protein n=1 Tax=Xylaria bambusicola TaxID=326684 RepID=UPI00200898E6|nr:uncharacterized protein F5B22DRAFT_631945 [Xylaria bambusicola]KAI0502825.1 hypothetical protein F5B22DRAFT_631945 [Xylaria bambusicola]